MDNIADDAPRPRLCHIRKTPVHNEFGFNLHAEKGKAGQFIGKVDEGSPAEQAGLKEGDRIIEVNGVNVNNENHQQVVERIRAVPSETKFLVVDNDAEEYYKERDIIVSSAMPNIIYLKTPLDDDTSSRKSSSSSSSSSSDSEKDMPLHKPRLCHLRKWPDYSGYGFSLHADKEKHLQFIGQVEEKSPAEASGLKKGDRIIEVNGIAVASRSHQDVIGDIRSNPSEVSLLVVDDDADKYFQEKDIEVSSKLSYVVVFTCPENNPHSAIQPSVTEATVEDIHPHVLRKCIIKVWPDSQGFGFSMHSEKGKNGQFIGGVDDDSPAFHAGLKKDDRIIEVNGINIEQLSHKEVVEKIKAIPDETTLLVIDPEAEEYFKGKEMTLSSSLSCVKVISSSDHKPTANGKASSRSSSEHSVSMDNRGEALAGYYNSDLDKRHDDFPEVGYEAINVSTSSYAEVGHVEVKTERTYAEIEEVKRGEIGDNEADRVADEIAAVAIAAQKETAKQDDLKLDIAAAKTTSKQESVDSMSPKSAPIVINGVEFAPSAKEARQRMNRKKNVKESPISMKDKYELFQKL